jgi:hypothetical protein
MPRQVWVTHPCPVNGCTEEFVPNEHLMCAAHWRRVPLVLQHEVHTAWNRGLPTEQYREARQAAIDAASGWPR